MKRILICMAALGVVALAPLAWAGSAGKCTYATQECLDKMAEMSGKKGWMGVEIDNETGQMVVTKVVEDSPAMAAGFQAGDVLVAVNGLEYGEKQSEEFAKLRETMVPGATFTFTVLKQGKEKADVPLTLGKMPDTILTAWIGKHMLEHATVAQAAEAKP
jgi:predicted metalloprotease with PDZ domain